MPERKTKLMAQMEQTTDKCTVISLVPFPIWEEKPGLIPGLFKIGPSENNEPQLLVVGDSIHYVWIDEDRGNLQVTTPARKVAQSIVDDYLESQLGRSEGIEPAIFWVKGSYTDPSIVKATFYNEIEAALAKQHLWKLRLVEIADDDWEKTRQHAAISDSQRIIAKSLGLERPWIVSSQTQQMVTLKNCPSCSARVPDSAVVCMNCRCILDMEKYKTMSFAVA